MGLYLCLARRAELYSEVGKAAASVNAVRHTLEGEDKNKLAEIIELTDRVTILRDGRNISTFEKEDPIAKNHIALMRGPVMLAQDTRLGFDLSKPCNILVGEEGYVDVVLTEKENIPYNHTVGALVPLKDGTFMTVTDYASAGKLWNEESEIAVWMLDK